MFDFFKNTYKLFGFDHNLGLDEANKEPILTTLHTAKIDNVPFPAVTIGGDSNVNKWGFAEKSFNFLTFYYPKVKSKFS